MAEDPIPAILDLLAAHSEQIARLGARAATAGGDTERVAELAALAADMDRRITALAGRPGSSAPPAADSDDPGGDGEAYVPAPARRWWKLDGQDREQAVRGLRAWVGQVYRPGYGQLAATLGPCWDQHPLCLYAVDILAELWSALYLTAPRTTALVTMQAEYQARILPALAEQMATETTRCPHSRARHDFPGPARRTP